MKSSRVAIATQGGSDLRLGPGGSETGKYKSFGFGIDWIEFSLGFVGTN